MSVYIILFCYTALTGYSINKMKNNHNKKFGKFLLFILMAVLVLVAGFRGVGSDYGNYVRVYENITKLTLEDLWISIIKFDEPGFKLLCFVSKLIYDSPTTMFVLSSLLTIAPCIWLIYKEDVDFGLAIILYLLLVWVGTFGAVRQCLAGAMVFCGYHHLKKRNFFKYLLWVVIGASFHITCLIMIPLYFIMSRKVSFKGVLLIIVSAIVLRYSYDFLFELIGAVKDKELGDYSYLTTEVNVFRILVAFAPIILFLFIPKKSKVEVAGKVTQLDLAMNAILINAALMFATMGSAYLARVGIYLSVFFPIAIPEIIKGYDKKSYAIIVLVMTVLYLAYCLYGVNAQGLEYITIFQRN